MARSTVAMVLLAIAVDYPSAAVGLSECDARYSTCQEDALPDPRTLHEIEAEEEAEVDLIEVRLLQMKAQGASMELAAPELSHSESSLPAVRSRDGKTEEQAGAARAAATVAQDEEHQKKVEADASWSTISYDHSGRVCLLCGKPLEERLGGKNYTEFRTDCGGYSSSVGPSVEALHRPAAEFLSLKSSAGSATNGFCELNFAKSCADAIANEDYLYWAKSLDLAHPDMEEGRHWDARYCHQNGFLEPDVVAMQHNFTALRARSQELCKTKYKKHGVERLTFKDMMTMSRYDDPSAPSLDEAEALAAWNCAMGDLGCDMAMCSYSFCHQGGGKLGLYGECSGWDPVHGMPM